MTVNEFSERKCSLILKTMLVIKSGFGVQNGGYFHLATLDEARVIKYRRKRWTDNFLLDKALFIMWRMKLFC